MKRMLSTEGSLSTNNSKIMRPISVDFDAKDRMNFGLCTFKEIEERFNQYCAESPYKELRLDKVASYRANNYERRISVFPNTDTVPNVTHETYTRINERENPPSILRSKISSRPKIANISVNWQQIDDDTWQLLKEFGISQAALMKLPTDEERRKYMIKTMNQKLDEDMERWKRELEQQESGIQKFENLIREREKRLKREKADVFKWLTVKTDFPSLTKKLKANLMELLNNFDNQKELEKSVAEIKESRDLLNRPKRITIKHHIPEINMTEILPDILGETETTFRLSKTSRHTQSSRSLLGDKPNSVRGIPRPFQVSTLSTTSRSGGQSTERLKTDDSNSKSTPSYQLLQSEVLSTQPTYVWDESSENVFREHKEEARARLFRNIKSTSWNEVGLAPFVVASHMDEKSKVQRNTKLKRYRRGQGLTPEEYKYIANTSLLLNSCSDKEFIQTAVNNLEPEIIHAVETEIAQGVLQDYQRARNMIKSARLEYLKNISERSRQVVHQNQELLDQMERTKTGSLEQQKMRKEIIARIESYDRRQNLDEKAAKEESSLGEAENTNRIETIVKKLMTPNRQSTQHRRARTPQFFNRANKDNFIDTKLSKRIHHPSSKILLNSETRGHDFIGLSPGLIEPKLLKRQNENAEDFKLHIHSSIKLRNPEHFKQFYAGGPLKYDFETGSAYYATDIPKFKGTELEHKAATLLKAQCKGLLQRDRFRFTERSQLVQAKVIKKMFSGSKTPVRPSQMILFKEFLSSKQDKDQQKVLSNLNPSFLDRENKKVSGLRIPNTNNVQSEVSILVDNSKSERRLNNPPTETARNPLSLELQPQQRYQMNSILSALKPIAKKIIDLPRKQETPEPNIRTEIDERANETPTKWAASNLKEPPKSMRSSKEDEQEKNLLNWSNIAVDSSIPKPFLRSQTARSAIKRDFDLNLQSKNTGSKESAAKNDKEGNELNLKKTLTAAVATSGTKNSKKQGQKEDKLVSEKRSISAPQREALKSEVETNLLNRNEEIVQRASPRKLLYKQRKLLIAARMNNLQLVKTSGFKYFESDINVHDERNNTPLYYAAKHGNMEFCQFLLDRGARVNDHCDKGNTPLHMAFLSNKEGVIMMLLIKAGNLNTLNHEGLTPLAYGSERLLTLLDLKSGVATYMPNDDQLERLPDHIDNNYLLSRVEQKIVQDEAAVLKYKALQSPDQPVRLNDGMLATYIHPESDR